MFAFPHQYVSRVLNNVKKAKAQANLEQLDGESYSDKDNYETVN